MSMQRAGCCSYVVHPSLHRSRCGTTTGEVGAYGFKLMLHWTDKPMHDLITPPSFPSYTHTSTRKLPQNPCRGQGFCLFALLPLLLLCALVRILSSLCLLSECKGSPPHNYYYTYTFPIPCPKPHCPIRLALVIRDLDLKNFVRRNACKPTRKQRRRASLPLLRPGRRYVSRSRRQTPFQPHPVIQAAALLAPKVVARRRPLEPIGK